MLRFAVNGRSGAEKSSLACATGASVAALARNPSRSESALELRLLAASC